MMNSTPNDSTSSTTSTSPVLDSMVTVLSTLSGDMQNRRRCSSVNWWMQEHSSNLPGGLKSRGLRIKGDDTPIQPGEFRDVDVPSGSIRDNILPLPYKEPSQVLFALFQNIVQEGRAFASSGDMNVSDMSTNAPVGTTLALLERTLKVMTAVQARLHYTMKQEFRLLEGHHC
jgi:hypothetical protein